jgi:hypothetical protein
VIEPFKRPSMPIFLFSQIQSTEPALSTRFRGLPLNP